MRGRRALGLDRGIQTRAQIEVDENHLSIQMTRAHRRLWSWAFLPFCACLSACAQDVQFLPEFDANLKLNSVVRVTVEAKGDREAGESVQSQIGPSIQFYLKPLLKLRKVTAFDLDDAKARILVVESGYSYLSAPNAPSDNRMLLITTSHLPLKAGFLISDRNRADLDWKGGGFTWRYRNKLEMERTVAIRSYHLIPYVASESYYESQYSKWSTTALYAGCLFPVGSHVQFDSYYEHENNTGKRPNTQDNEVGLALHLYFVRQKH
jgi:hypothetical protein